MQHIYGCDLDGDEMTGPCAFCDPKLVEQEPVCACLGKCRVCGDILPHEHDDGTPIPSQIEAFREKCIEALKDNICDGDNSFKSVTTNMDDVIQVIKNLEI